jgi:uncharacterized protein (DUF433 family)
MVKMSFCLGRQELRLEEASQNPSLGHDRDRAKIEMFAQTFSHRGPFDMPKLDYRNIESDATRCGGQPVVVGTRIRVATILACYRQGMGVEEIVQQYPSLKPADVHDALAYAYNHLDEIEAALAADDEATVKARYSAHGSGG